MALSPDHPLLVEALEIFDKEGLSYIPMLKGGMVWVDSKSGRRYAFYPTTGRWSNYGNRKNHYRSRGAQDFVDRFVKKSEEEKKQVEDGLKGIIPTGCTCSLEELLLYAFEQFEEGKTPYRVFWDIKNEMRSTVKDYSNQVSKEHS